MDIVIRKINDDVDEIDLVKDFLFDQIKKEYDIGPTPKFHYDILDLEKYYIIPNDSAFFIAVEGNNIVATAAIRPYDKDFEFFRDIYSKEDTASIWRLMVDKDYRRHGLARNLVKEMEDFAENVGYDKVYFVLPGPGVIIQEK
jgi:GNAT superfamily N-acetyltransferase